ncbi:winged helix-turn-helix domain-containing protein [Candidatus Micrarchaeota archaeon]|nr:winged helix-turn-helix domain-containing protein [Candidatus Micrarchaeota archaeon]
MSHIEIYKIKGKFYKYEVKNFRVGKQVKHRKRYLGPVSPLNSKKNVGRKPSIFVSDLTQGEKHELRQAKRNESAFIRDRAKIILLSSEGKNAKIISGKLQKEYAKILKIISDFNKKRLEILKRKSSGGRPKRITEEQISDLIETADKIPREVGLPYSNWTCKLLGKWFSEKYNEELSSEWIRVLLRRNGITYTVPKHKMMKADEKLRGAFKKN